MSETRLLFKLFQKSKKVVFEEGDFKEEVWVKNPSSLDTEEMADYLEKTQVETEEKFDKILGRTWENAFIASTKEELIDGYVRLALMEKESDLIAMIPDEKVRKTEIKKEEKALKEKLKDVEKDRIIELTKGFHRKFAALIKKASRMRAVQAACCTYSDEDCTERYFNNPEEIMRLDDKITNKLIEAIKEMQLSEEELKKNTEERTVQKEGTDSKNDK